MNEFMGESKELVSEKLVTEDWTLFLRSVENRNERGVALYFCGLLVSSAASASVFVVLSFVLSVCCELFKNIGFVDGS